MPFEVARPGTKPTPAELAAAKAVMRADSKRAAAAELGTTERMVRYHLANLRIRMRARNNEQLFYLLRDVIRAA